MRRQQTHAHAHAPTVCLVAGPLLPMSHAYTESIQMLLDLFTEDTGHGQDDNVPGNYFLQAEFKELYLMVYPYDDAALFPRGGSEARQVATEFRTTIAAHLGLLEGGARLEDTIRYNRRVMPAEGGNKVQASHAVLGRALKKDASALAVTEAERVKPAAILSDLQQADVKQPLQQLPPDLRRRIASRWLCPDSWKRSNESSQWEATLVQQLQTAPDTEPLSAALRDRLELADGWARHLADGDFTISTPSFIPDGDSTDRPTLATLSAAGFPGDLTMVLNPNSTDPLRVAARDYARRRARTFDDSGSGGGGGGGGGGDDDDGSGGGGDDDDGGGGGGGGGGDGGGVGIGSSGHGGSGSADGADGGVDGVGGDDEGGDDLEAAAAAGVAGASSATISVVSGKRDREDSDREDSGDCCVICLLPVANAVVQLDCGHEFCPRCIQKWFYINPVCPNCKRNPRCQRHFKVEDGRRSLIGEHKVHKVPSQADKVQPDGVNGARHAPDTIVSRYHRAVLRVFNQLVTAGPHALHAQAGYEAAGTSQGRQLRPRRR